MPGELHWSGNVRAAASEPEAARLARKLLGREVFARITEALEVDDAGLRASLVGSQMVGPRWRATSSASSPLELNDLTR